MAHGGTEGVRVDGSGLWRYNYRTVLMFGLGGGGGIMVFLVRCDGMLLSQGWTNSVGDLCHGL